MLNKRIVPTYRLTKPIPAIPVGENAVTTIPMGALVESDQVLKNVGVTVVKWDAKRFTVLALDCTDNVQLATEIG